MSLIMSEDAVDFQPDYSGDADLELLEKLGRARANMHGGLVDSNDEDRINDFTDVEEEVIGDVLSEDVLMCPDHKDQVIEYFCKEDSVKVCKECLIFGVHKNHDAISLKEEQRCTALLDIVNNLQSAVQLKLQEVENMRGDMLRKLEDESFKLKDELGELFDGIQTGEKKKVSSMLSDHKQHIKNAINRILSVKARDSIPNKEILDRVARLGKSLPLYVTPGCVETQGEHLIVKCPAVETERKSHSNDGDDHYSNEVIEDDLKENGFPLPDSSLVLMNKIGSNQNIITSEGSDSGIEPGQLNTDQVYSSPTELSDTARMCSQYNLLSPESILLFFDNHITEHRIGLLAQIKERTNLVRSPRPGQAVLASWNGCMCRAQVLSVSSSKLQVLYVDYGNIDIVDWRGCFVVPQDLLFEPLATQVRLGRIKPVSEEGWSMEVRQRLFDLLLMNNGKLKVKFIKTEELLIDTREAELFIYVEDDYKDVGQCLVSEGFAKYDERVDSIAINLSSRSTCEGVKMVENKGEVFPVETPARGYGEGIYENHTDVEVKVIRIVSPDEIFVRRVEDSDRWIKFQLELQKVGAEYEISVENEKIESNQKVLCKVGKCWYRATVLSVDEFCKVRLVDLADVIKVEIHNVIKLEESSNVVKEQVFLKKVGLPGIEPAGSSGWSASSIDLLERIAMNYKVNLRTESDKTDLVVLNVTSNNPFDLENISRYSVSQMLMDKGVALKTHTRKKCAKVFTDV